jgi:hypothetical protein
MKYKPYHDNIHGPILNFTYKWKLWKVTQFIYRKEYTTALTDNINKPSMITNFKLVRRRAGMEK